jgi:hypothetical protein
MEGGAVRYNIEKGPPKDHPSQICFNLMAAVAKNRDLFNCPLLL